MSQVRGQSIQMKHGTYDAAVPEGVEDDDDLRSVTGFPEKQDQAKTHTKKRLLWHIAPPKKKTVTSQSLSH